MIVEFKLNEKLAKIIILAAFFTALVSIFLFAYLYNSKCQNINSPTDELNHFATFIAGTVGVLISFAGTILIYVSLNNQREEISNNQKTIMLQIDQLEIQSTELELTREVFNKQSITADLQRFENTFFNLISLLNSTKNSINHTEFTTTIIDTKTTVTNGTDAMFNYLIKAGNLYRFRIEESQKKDLIQEKLEFMHKCLVEETFNATNPFFNTFYLCVEFIHSSNLENKKIYVEILKGQMNLRDLVIISHHCLFDSRKNLILEYGILNEIKPDNFADHDFYIVLMKKL